MKNRKIITSFIAGILAAVLVLGLLSGIAPVIAGASENKSSSQIKEDIKEAEAEKKEIDKKLSELRGQMSDNMNDMEAIVEQKNLIDQEVFLLYQKVANINIQISDYGKLIADKQEELDAAEAHLAELQEQNKQRIRAMEKNAGVSYWSVIFQANSFIDMLDRIKMIQQIAEADKRRLEEMTAAAQVVAEAKSGLEEEKAELENSKLQLEEAQVDLEERRAEADKLLAELVAKGEEYEALVHEAEQESIKMENAIDDLESDYKVAKDREYQEWLAAQPKPKPSTSTGSSSGGSAGTSNTVGNVTWLVPCNYSRFSSPFGMRIHPVYKDWRMHYGVDLGAAEGTPIIATRSGTVSAATFDRTAGFYVNINHGDGFVSRYLHMTHYIVSVGQQVEAGQVIGYVGSTGTSTGAHLHFGIYYNGVAVNPANYIKIS